MSFKIGDVVRCRPGYLGGEHRTDIGVPANRDFTYGGFGYVEDKVFTINDITDSRDRPVVWSDELDGGVFIDAIELYNGQSKVHHGSKLIFRFV